MKTYRGNENDVIHCAENFDLHHKYEYFITSLLEKNKKQTTIDQYFKKSEFWIVLLHKVLR